uniref:Uncharacterized protein n=1 Tax=Kalanchoe fedtschenkoi TaxID=63787 RepID=A0A7N0RHG3_KALFE
MAMTTTRRRPPLRWQPPTPRVLNFPRRHVRRPPSSAGKRGTRRLEALFDEERAFGKDGMGADSDVPIVVLRGGGGEREEDEDEGRREVAGVESEMLRAECRLLRMERELALKKLKRNRARMERLLRSALQILISGRDKVGGSVCDSLDEEIEAMRCKLVDLQRVSGAKVFESHQRDTSSSFDDQDSNSLSRLVLDGNQIPREIQELAEASLSIHASSAAERSFGESSSRFTEMELLSMKMEGLSNGTLFERLETSHGLMKLSKVDSFVASYASSSCTTERPDSASYIIHHHSDKEGTSDDEKQCSGRCRAVVRRVVEQVRIETEQWSQMQEMAEKVKEEMEQLQASRDMWEQKALDSENQITSLHCTVQEWKRRAFCHEAKMNDLQTQVHILQQELKMLRDGARTNSSSPKSTEGVRENEKRVLICQLKESCDLKGASNRQYGCEEKKKQHPHNRRLEVPKRSPFRDIGNSSPLMRQITKVVFPGHRR